MVELVKQAVLAPKLLSTSCCEGTLGLDSQAALWSLKKVAKTVNFLFSFKIN